MTQERWHRLTRWPLIAAAVVFLIVYSWWVITDATGADAVVAGIVLILVWAMFAVDYLAQLALTPAGERGAWFRSHLFALATVVLPALRPLQLLRVITALHPFRRTAGTALRTRTILYATGATALVVYTAALAVLDAERHAPGATITTLGDAIWWGCVTVTSVGYGDLTPVTAAGRAVATALMLGGITLLSVVTATLASWMSDKIRGAADAPATDLARIESKIDELRSQLDHR
ncbi:potassium channel family protein [Microbacterium sp.]|uniref:potassium channel family protein n=1 Tax=Microbacterium sp. TaxID=51671 RepID=UPI003A863DA0